MPDRRSAFRIAVVDDRGRCDNSPPPRWAGGRKISCSNFTNSALRCDRGQSVFRAGLSQVNRRSRRESGRSGIPYTVGSSAPKAAVLWVPGNRQGVGPKQPLALCKNQEFCTASDGDCIRCESVLRDRTASR